MRESGFLPPLPLPDAEDTMDPYKGATIADLKLPEAVTIGSNVWAAMPRQGGRAQVDAVSPRDARYGAWTLGVADSGEGGHRSHAREGL